MRPQAQNSGDKSMSPVDAQIQAEVFSIRYYPKISVGMLYMADGECCDMSGAIELFQGIDPAVRAINTFSGDEPDTMYFRRGGEWTAYITRPRSARQSSWCKIAPS